LYRCQGENAWLALTVDGDDAWRSLTTLIGRPELAEDPRYRDMSSRRDHHDELDEVVQAWASQQSLLDAFRELQAAGVPAGPVLDDDGFARDPHVSSRSWLHPLHSGDVGAHLHAGAPYAGVPQAWRRGSPTLGEDNEYVYKTLLSVSDEEFERYRESKILAEDYLDPSGEPY
jgi:crotonobetainyl-CoA:carnitine CoA-transferase CaiB-like acyl-CoA transferase